MKLIIALILLWTSAVSHAALFNFATAAAAQIPSDQSSSWAVDLTTARQWYLAWSASADRVYQRMINPDANVARTSGPQNSKNTLLSEVVFVGVSGLLVAALVSAAKSVSKVLLMSHRRVVRTAS
jgi:hypothetical protein